MEKGDPPGPSPLPAPTPACMLTTNTAVLPLLVPPPHLAALLIITARQRDRAAEPCWIPRASSPHPTAHPMLTGGGPGCQHWPAAAPARGSPRCAAHPGGSAGTPVHPAGCKAKGHGCERPPGLCTHRQPHTASPYLYPTKRGAYLWICVLNSEGLTLSLGDEVQSSWISFANSVCREEAQQYGEGADVPHSCPHPVPPPDT